MFAMAKATVLHADVDAFFASVSSAMILVFAATP
jgi:hypothetical protein